MDRGSEKKNRRQPIALWVAVAGLLVATGTSAEEERNLGMNVIGNKETPRTLIIVPWKSAEPGDLTLRPLQSLVDTSIGPLDREVFRREMRWREAQQQKP
ncbi:MAG: hypothetical protein Kow006_26900 [Gammaproteobacteria bacterium]